MFAANATPIGQSLLLQYADAFSRDYWQNWTILGAFIVVFFTGTCLVLRRKARPS